jgi:hypothetical protein
VKKSVKEKIVKMSEIIRKDLVQNVDQSFEDDDHDQLDQLSTSERSSMHEEITHQIDSKTSEILQTGLNKDSHQEMSNSHTDMNASQSFENSQSFDRQRVSNLHTDMKESQSFERQSSQFRTSQSFQSAISTTKLFTLSREKRSLFESIRSLVDSLIRSHENETRRHSTDDVSRVKIRSSSSSLMNQIDEIPTEQISLKIIDIFGRLNIADKIEKVKEIVKEKDKTKEQQFKSSKSSSSRSIESSDLNSANIIESKRNRKPNSKYAQLVYEE